MLNPIVTVGIGIIFIVLVLNLFIMRKRVKSSGKSKGRNYKPPVEEAQKEWRDKEIARRIDREQSDAYERVTLRNETLSYYEFVRRKYEKKEALERLGIKVDDDKLEEIKSLTPEEHQEIQYRDVRDDIYVLEDPKNG